MDQDTSQPDGRGAAKSLPDEHAALQIHLLGDFRVVIDGRVLADAVWTRRRAESLLKLLALAPGHSLHREQVVDYLWPDADLDSGLANLRYTVHVARRILTDVASAGGVLRLRGEQVTLAPDGGVWVDVDAFEQAAERASLSGRRGDHEAAIALYAGELLPENRYEDWTTGRRERVRDIYLVLLGGLARLQETGQEYSRAEATLQRMLDIDAANEQAHVGLMRLHLRAGRRQRALRQYEVLRDALRQDLDVDPEPATQKLYAEILAGRAAADVATEPADAGQQTAPTLPLPLTSFVGRERELQELSGALASARLLTLVGPGGAGKTRLALETARSLAGEYRDGVRLVELASLTDASLVTQSVAAACGVVEQPDRPLSATLVDGLASSQLLLVLDNCEHLLDEVASLLVVLLAGCPRLTVLATSREAIRVPGEVIWRVAPLAIPSDNEATAEALVQIESVRLLIERARGFQPDFSLTSDNAVAVADICRRLDGLPLAIELAAARLPTLGVAQLASRLENALLVLASGDRVAPLRQQTLRATLDWSYGLLSEDEQGLFHRLSVFVNGWTLDAAEALVDDVTAGDTLSLLAQLVEKSLVLVYEQGGTLRYRMLVPIQQYASERLEASGEREAVRRRHAELFLAFAEAAEPHLRGAEQAEQIARIEVEHDNLRTAFGWALAADPHLALQLAVALGRFWYVRGDVRAGIASLRDALAAAPDAAGSLRSRGMYHAGILLSEAGDEDQSAVLLEEALALLRDTDDLARIAAVLNSLGVVQRQRGDLDRARSLFEESLAIRREIGDPIMIDIALGNLALLAWSQGDLDLAETLLEETRAFAEQHGDDWSIAILTAHLGRIAWDRGQYARALELFSESLAMARRVGDQGMIAEGLEGVAGTVGMLGNPAGVARLWGAAEALREALDLPIPAPERGFNDRMVASVAEHLDAGTFAAAWADGRGWSVEDAIQSALTLVEQAEAAQHPASTDAQEPVLTERQLEIARLIAGGQTNQQIAVTLGIAPRTADTHVSAILRKLGFTSRSQVAGWLATYDFFPDPA